MTQGAVRVEGLRSLNRALAKADRDVRLGMKKKLREAAEPVRAEAQSRAASQIRNIAPGDPWSKMRTGVTQTLVYVVPRPRGVKRGNKRARSNLADLLANRAMQPALRNNIDEAERRVDELLDSMARDFNGR